MNIKILNRIVAYMLAVIVVFMMLGFAICKIEYVLYASPSSTAIFAGSSVCFFLRPAIHIPDTLVELDNKNFNSALTAQELIAGRRAITQTAWLLMFEAMLYISIALIFRRFRYGSVIYNKQLPILSLSIGGNSPPRIQLKASAGTWTYMPIST